MKKLTFILSLCFTIGIFTSYSQDTLKFKTIKTDYYDGDTYDYFGELNGTVINTDTFTSLFPGPVVTNISNDTFSSDVMVKLTIDFLLYDTAGLLLEEERIVSQSILLGMDFSPNDTMVFTFVKIPLLVIIDYYKGIGIELEQIGQWKLISGVSYTSEDGYYSDSIFYAGADTSIFYVVKTPTVVQIMAINQTEISVYPNPAQSQFTVTNTENANLTLYNILGQQVKQIVGKGENTLIYTEDLPQGIYILKIEKGDAVVTKKVQIIN